MTTTVLPAPMLPVQAATRPFVASGGGGESELTDAVFEQARQGDDLGFVRLVRAHQARVYSLALRLTGRVEDAEELAQDTFLQLHSQLQHLESATHVRHWVCRTVTHRAIDLLRSRARRPQTQSIDELELGAPDGPGDDPLLYRTLRRLLLQLPELPRAVLVLRFQEDLDPSDIATTLNLPLNTVKSHLRRSLDWLRTQGLEMPR